MIPFDAALPQQGSAQADPTSLSGRAAALLLDASGVEYVLAGVLLLVTATMILGFLATVRKEPPRLESHWGGFGGGLGGWRLSSSAAFLLAAMAFGLMFMQSISSAAERRLDIQQDSVKLDLRSQLDSLDRQLRRQMDSLAALRRQLDSVRGSS